ncbi:MAG: FAD-dependent oxidoreductase [Sporomusaceae bacterium]|nr:FAD-dependent oxidoreductase [Sporomusaceae bacterium]
MIHVIIVGGGWSGCAAALAAAKAGATVSLYEKSDMLLGTGLVGGIFRNNGRFTAAEEAIAMGGGDLFLAMDANARHKNIAFPGHNHASLYDVALMEPKIKALLTDYGVGLYLQTRIVDVTKYGKKITSLFTQTGEELKGDVFVDATGSAGPMGNCMKYGNGCAMCILRCPAFGPRVSITGLCGIKEMASVKEDGTVGAMSGSCKLNKESLSKELQGQLNETGVALIPLPPKFNKKNVLGKKACSQYALPEFGDNLILLDTGHAKLMTSYFPLEELRQLPGLEKARFEDPYAGGKGNSMRYLGIAPNDLTLQVEGMENLFCCGEKCGALVGHTEAIITGLLAGHNAVRYALDMNYLLLSRDTASGDFIAFIHEQATSPDALGKRYTFSGSVYFDRMKVSGLYSADSTVIQARAVQTGMAGVYSQCLV